MTYYTDTNKLVALFREANDGRDPDPTYLSRLTETLTPMARSLVRAYSHGRRDDAYLLGGRHSVVLGAFLQAIPYIDEAAFSYETEYDPTGLVQTTIIDDLCSGRLTHDGALGRMLFHQVGLDALASLRS